MHRPPHRIIFVDVVLQQNQGGQKPLRTIDSIDESLHDEHQFAGAAILPAAREFSHSLGRQWTRSAKTLSRSINGSVAAAGV